MWRIEQRADGKWEWMQMVSCYGLVQGVSDTRQEAERDLKLAWYDLTAGE